MLSLEQELKGNAYPGRGIVIGKTKDGKKAAIAYFIMGRSENSRNRVFVEDGEGDAAEVERTVDHPRHGDRAPEGTAQGAEEQPNGDPRHDEHHRRQAPPYCFPSASWPHGFSGASH